MTRVIFIAGKEFIQVFRDPRLMFIIFVTPVIQLFLFGYAVTMDVNNITVAVMDQDRSSESRRLLAAVFNSGYFTRVNDADSERDLAANLVHTRADLALVIPPHFARDLNQNRDAAIQFLLDGTESNSATVGMGYIAKTLANYARAEINTRLAGIAALTGGKVRSLPLITAQTRFQYNPELRSSLYFVPGVLAMILMIVTMLLTSLAITREREAGTIEQLVVTPIKPYQLILGKMLPFIIIGFADIVIILIVAVGHFHLPMRGSVALLFFAALCFLFSTLGVGLLISTISRTQQQAIFAGVLFLNPAILLSGLMFPIENMPRSVQYLTYINPLRYFLVIMRGIILKGNGILVLADQFFMLFAIGFILFSIAVSRFKKNLE
jgi:ABC-2 type transport system permease protein